MMEGTKWPPDARPWRDIEREAEEMPVALCVVCLAVFGTAFVLAGYLVGRLIVAIFS